MKKFIKENWLKISIVIVLLIIALSAVYYFVIFLPNSQQKNLSEGFDLQTKCATEAAKFYKQFTGEVSQLGYTNHWNAKLDKCFILANDAREVGGDTITSSFLMDVIENKTYGDFVNNSAGITGCSLYKNGNIDNQQNCKSKEEFDNFVKQYMEE